MPRFWIRHAALPLIVYGLLMSVILGGGLDRRMAHDWAFSATGGWVGAHTWWAQTLIHRGGRALIWLIALAALAIFASTYVSARYCHLRRSALYIVVAMVLSAGVAGLLKEVTHVDCPWSLSEFGGERPYVALFERRPAILPRAACFPGAHSSSGFALMSFYFALRSRARRAARWALAGGVLTGAIFAFGQEARGAHFLSHDLSSAILVWCVLLGLYRWMLQGRVRDESYSPVARARAEPLAGQHHA